MSIVFPGYRTGFPFKIKHKSANGLPFEQWDGSTVDIGGSPDSANGADVYGQGTTHPIGMAIDQLAELYWRTKELIVDYDYTFNYSSGSSYSAGPASGLSAPIQIPFGTNATKEWELCKNVDSPIHSASENLPTVGTSILEVNYNDVWFSDGLYYSSIRIGMGGVFNNISSGSEGGALANPVSGLTVDFLGLINLDLWGSNVLTTIGINPPYSGSGTIAINPVSYWPYNGKWNTTTGAPA